MFKQFKLPFKKTKVHLKWISIIYSFFSTFRGIMTNTKMNAIDKWPLIFDRISCKGLEILQRLWTISCFLYFFAIFLRVFRGHFSAIFFSKIWDHNIKPVLSKIPFVLWTLSSRIPRNMYEVCIKSPTFLPQYVLSSSSWFQT